MTIEFCTPRVGTSGEVVEASLASDDASFFVGQIVSPNGGVVTF